MVQMFNPSPVPTQWSQLGAALGQGIGRNFEQPEQRVQRGLLSKALGNLKEQKPTNILDTLSLIGPSLMTTQGGPELLGQIFPLLQQEAKNAAFAKANAIGFPRGQAPQPGVEAEGSSAAPAQMQAAMQGQQAPQMAQAAQMAPQRDLSREEANKYGIPGMPPSPQTGSFSSRTVEQPQPLLSTEEMQQYAENYARQTGNAGSYEEGLNKAIQINDQRLKNNQQLEVEKQTRQNAIEGRQKDIFQRAKSDRLITTDENGNPTNPEDRTVLDNLMYQYKDIENPGKYWEEIRKGFRSWDKARSALANESTLAGPGSKLWRKMLGSYKDKEFVQQQLHTNVVPEFLKNGMVEELRNGLMTGIGMGPEDAEATIYRPTKMQNENLAKFPKNIEAKKNKIAEAGHGKEAPFAGEESKLSPKQYDKFKLELQNYLRNNNTSDSPMNLLALRGYLNREKRYDWTDISKAVNELIDEGNLKLHNQQQTYQKSVLDQAPLPGLTEMFGYALTGTK